MGTRFVRALSAFFRISPRISRQSGDSSRVCLPTDYANSQGIHLDEQSSAPSSCYWWLRSSGANNSFAECVCNDGSISSRGYEVGSTGIGVRPCIWVLLS